MAVVYHFRGHVVVHAQRGHGGYYVAAEPCITLAENDSPASVGQAIRAALAAHDHSAPPEGLTTRDIMQPVLKAARARSYRELQLEANHVSVVEEDGRIIYTPSHNGGIKGEGRGFAPIPGAELVCPQDSSDDALGDACRNAIGRCTKVES